ncbi:MAG: PAS domain S-box protein [Thiotrichaceae bacterium]
MTNNKLKINELRDKLALLSCIFDDIDIGIAMTDARGRFVRVNAAYCKLYGYQLEELIGQSFTLLLPPAVRTQAMQHHTAFLAGHNDYPSFWILQHHDGKIIKQSMIENRVQCSDGRQFKITLVLPENLNRSEHSEQQRTLETEFNLIDSNLWIHKFLNQLPVTVLCLDREGKLITAQGQLLELLGLTQNSLGKLTFEIKTLAPFYEAISRALAGDTFSKTVGYKDAALETHYQAVMESGKWIGNLMILNDITSYRLSQMRLRNAQYELAALIPQVKSALIYTENDRIIRVNSACCELFDYTEAELLALPLTQLHPDFHTHLQLQAASVSKKSSLYRIEQTVRSKNGALVACALTLRPLPPRRALWLLEKIEIKEADTSDNSANTMTVTTSDAIDLQDVWDQLYDALLILDQDLCIQQGNIALEQLTGYSIQELRRQPLQNLDKNIDNSAYYQELQQQLQLQPQQHIRLEQRHKQGHIYACQATITRHCGANRLSYIAVLQTTPELQLFDNLTGLPLRALFDFNLQKI